MQRNENSSATGQQKRKVPEKLLQKFLHFWLQVFGQVEFVES